MFPDHRPTNVPAPPPSAYDAAVRRGKQLRRQRHAQWGGGSSLAVLMAVGLVFLRPFAGSDEVPPGIGIQPSSSSSSPSPIAEPRGCPATPARVPATAKTGWVSDLDGDGRDDQLWLGADNRLGVSTASGATFSVRFQTTEASQVEAQAIRLGDGSAVVLLSGSRSSAVFAVVGCSVVATQNATSGQYKFDNGFVTPGSAWGCADVDGERQLVGLQRTQSGSTSAISQTRIVLRQGGRSAVNGTTRTIETDLSGPAAADRLTQLSHRSTCNPSTSVPAPN